MVHVGKSVTAFLDSRYTDEGTEIAQKELANVAKGSIDVLSIPVNTKIKRLKNRNLKLVDTNATVQYSAKSQRSKKNSKLFF